MSIASTSGRRVALSGGSIGSARPRDVPALITAPLANPSVFWEDFHATTISPAFAGDGMPGWLCTEPAGTNGNARITTSTSGYGQGVVNIVTGATANNSYIFEKGGLTTGAGTEINIGTNAACLSCVGMVRFQFPGTGTSAIRGIGWVTSTLAVGTDWVTDPNTTFAASAALIVTKHNAVDGTTVYGAAGAFGDMVLRYYSPNTTDNTAVVLVTQAAFSATTWYKLEFYYNIATDQLLVYFQGVLVATITYTDAAAASAFRFSSGAVALGANARQVAIDCVYVENSLATAR